MPNISVMKTLILATESYSIELFELVCSLLVWNQLYEHFVITPSLGHAQGRGGGGVGVRGTSFVFRNILLSVFHLHIVRIVHIVTGCYGEYKIF